jgi:hypothetical protein
VSRVRIQDQPNKVIVEGDGELVKVVGQGPQGPRGVPGLDGVGAPVFGQVAKMTSGTITIAAQGVYQSTGLTAVLDGEAAGISLGTVDLFAVKNTSGFTRRLKIAASYDAAMAGATKQLGLGLAINGVFDPDTECRATTGIQGAIAKLQTAWIIDLPDGQEVAMRVANFTSTDAIQFQRGRIVATSVAGFGPQGPQGPVGPIGPVGGVDSVNGDTGVVVLNASDVGAYPDTNPSSFVDAAGASAAAPVQSVNTFTGAVVLDAADVGAYADTNPSSFVDAAGAAAAAPVQSVNGGTGVVVLDAGDVGAYPDTNPLNFIDSAGAPVQSVNGDTGAVTLGAADVGAVPTSRTISTSGTGLSGGGDLTADRTITLDPTALAGDAAFDALGAIPTGGATAQVLAKASGTNYDTAWNDPKFSWNTASGFYYGPPSATVSITGSGFANRITAVPMFFPKPTTIDRIAFRIFTGGAAGSIVRLGVYASTSSGLPGALLHDFGTVDGTVTGNPVAVTVSATLDGFVWLAARFNDQQPATVFLTSPSILWAPAPTSMSLFGAGFSSAVQTSGDNLLDPFPLSGATEATSAVNIRVRAA